MNVREQAILDAISEVLKDGGLPSVNMVRNALPSKSRASTICRLVEGMERKGLVSLVQVTEDNRPMGVKGPCPVIIVPKGTTADEILAAFKAPVDRRTRAKTGQGYTGDEVVVG